MVVRFGLEAENVDMADEMVGQALMPALREQPDAQVMANGFACRQQMRALGDPRARHLATLLREHLEPGAEP